MSKHYTKLENMYTKAPFNKFLKSSIKIDQGVCEIIMKIKNEMHNEIKTMHNAYYFMLLDNSAFFAINSLVEDVIISTKSFEIDFLKPIQSGDLIAKAKFVEKTMGNYIASAKLFDQENNLIGKGRGIYRRSKQQLNQINNYQ
tara:strand:+ start:190 stop:618 length:429 start_codon:yes stop_codon:yes gene_type:complete